MQIATLSCHPASRPRHRLVVFVLRRIDRLSRHHCTAESVRPLATILAGPSLMKPCSNKQVCVAPHVSVNYHAATTTGVVSTHCINQLGTHTFTVPSLSRLQLLQILKETADRDRDLHRASIVFDGRPGTADMRANGRRPVERDRAGRVKSAGGGICKSCCRRHSCRSNC